MAVALPPFALPGINPKKGEIDNRRAARYHKPRDDASCEWKFVPRLISPLEGEMPGRAKGGKRHTLRRRNRHTLRGQTHAR
jgi:diaminohydroxyphosphoribosylaminopyrimidine deaminase/5-amino-6-(5-phosphoribosylamino)uracil reductase